MASPILIDYFTALDLGDQDIRRHVLLWTLLLDNARVHDEMRSQIFNSATRDELEQAIKAAQLLYDRDLITLPPRNFQEEHQKWKGVTN